ncbi:MAG: L-alanine exporter AlaE [Patescibacteria group bacterium]|nr:L-alanine exporter AlaE [Patescibacteria group bacterium]
MNKNRFIHFIRRAFADAWLAILSTFFVSFIHEYWYIGMPLLVVVKTRLMAAFLRTLYGLYRDEFTFLVTRKRNNYTLREYIICNTLSSLIYNGPTYLIILYVSGASPSNTLVAVRNVLILSIFLGVFYGLFLDFFRNLFDVTIPKILGKVLKLVFQK